MKRLLLLTVLFTLPASADEKPWLDLLQGDSLAAWVDAKGKPVAVGKWQIEDKVLHLTGKGGGSLYTAKHYGNFELSFEWKIAEKGNSGVKYRMTKYEGKGLLGPEYQVYDDQGKEHAKGSAAGLYDIVPPDAATKKLKPVGEWNLSRIVVKGSHLQHFLNGARTVDITVGTPAWKKAVSKSKFANVVGFAENAKGPLMLQDHGSEVWFRALRVREL